MRASSWVVGLSAALALGACKKGAPAGGEGERPARPAQGGEAPADKPAGGGAVAQRTEKAAAAGCDLPAAVDHDFTLKKGCEVRPEESVLVSHGATLTLEAGSKLRFAPGARLEVGEGRLVAQGTQQEPVLLGSLSKTPAAGDWEGVIFSGDAAAGSLLDHVVLECAGKQGSWGASALMVAGEQGAGRISVTNSVIQQSAEVAVSNHAARFGKFEGNTIKGAPLALDVDAEVLGSVGANSFGAPLKVEGNVSQSAAWPRTEQPFVISADLTVSGKGQAAVLTLPDKAVLRFNEGAGLVVGQDHGGGLVARGVTFTSANATPNPGDWAGLTFLEGASVLTLEGATVAYAGKSNAWGDGTVRFVGAARLLGSPQTSLKNVAFTKAGGAFVLHTDEARDCAGLAAPALGNKSDGPPLCAKPE